MFANCGLIHSGGDEELAGGEELPSGEGEEVPGGEGEELRLPGILAPDCIERIELIVASNFLWPCKELLN
jgi:hypothetical protein